MVINSRKQKKDIFITVIYIFEIIIYYVFIFIKIIYIYHESTGLAESTGRSLPSILAERVNGGLSKTAAVWSKETASEGRRDSGLEERRGGEGGRTEEEEDRREGA